MISSVPVPENLERSRGSRGAVFNAEFRERPLKMFRDGPPAHAKDRPDLFVCLPFGNPAYNLGFSAGQAERLKTSPIRGSGRFL